MVADLAGCDNAAEHAPLIAAAPELLDSLLYVDACAGVSREKLAKVDPGMIVEIQLTAQGLLDIFAAIAKATGQS